jgi:DNA primase
MPTIVVEGPMDALAAAGLGYQAIAILGVDPPKVVYDHVAKLVARSYMKNKAIIIPDMDRVARWQETQQELGQRGVRGELKQVPYGRKDLAECTPDERKEFLYGCY